jgi:uncharacterized damage-inducible protein DinB
MPDVDVRLLAGVNPQVAVWCAGLDRGQGPILNLIQDLTPDQLAQVPPGLDNSIATLVLHVAAIEARMAHRIAGRPMPADLQAEFLLDQPQNPLPQARGETAETLRAKAEKARDLLRQTLADVGEADLAGQVPFGSGTATVRFALAVLPTHQAQHYGQMQMIRRLV